MGRAPKLDIEKREEVVKSFATGKEEEAAEHTLQVDTNRFQDLVFFAVLAYMVTKNNEDMKTGLQAIKKNFFDMQPAQQVRARARLSHSPSCISLSLSPSH